MKLQRTLPLLVLLLSSQWLISPLVAQDGWGDSEELACDGLLAAAPADLAAVLAQVPKYASTYVVVYTENHAGRFAPETEPSLAGLGVAVSEGGPAASLAAELGQEEVRAYALEDGVAGASVEDVLAGSVDVALLWAPLAALGAQALDLDYALSMLSVGLPSSPPPVLTTAEEVAASAEMDPCAEELLVLLESYGVVPAEKRVPLHIRDLFDRRPPERDIEAAHLGKALYGVHCAKCHGPEGVAARDALAPVDLLVSVQRFSYPGFLYIIWNGRNQNGMPTFRGALDEEQVAQVYQYVRERSYGTLGVEEPQPVATEATGEVE